MIAHIYVVNLPAFITFAFMYLEIPSLPRIIKSNARNFWSDLLVKSFLFALGKDALQKVLLLLSIS